MGAKKILVMPDGNWLAHVSRPLEIAKVLRQMGHEVIFAGNGRYMRLLDQAGFAIVSTKIIDPGRLLECIRRGRVNPFAFNELKEFVKEDLELFDRLKPDVVLSDLRVSLSTSCQVAKIPLVAIMNASVTNYYAVKIRSVEHAKTGWLIKKILGRRLYTWLELPNRIKKVIVTIDSFPYRKLRKKVGLTPYKNICDVIEGDLNLLTDIPEYAPTNNLPSNFHYIGPIIWEPEVEPPAWLNDLNRDKPTLYFTMGSTGNPRFFQEAVKLFGNTEYQCIMTTCGTAHVKDAPRNFFVTDYAPADKIMEKSDAVICHGGNGTIYQALSYAVPVIGIPTHWDQEFNMQRVVDLGIGIQLSELKFEPSHLADAVRKILMEKSYKEKAQQFQKILARYRGPQTGAQLIDRFLAVS